MHVIKKQSAQILLNFLKKINFLAYTNDRTIQMIWHKPEIYL